MEGCQNPLSFWVLFVSSRPFYTDCLFLMPFNLEYQRH